MNSKSEDPDNIEQTTKTCGLACPWAMLKAGETMPWQSATLVDDPLRDDIAVGFNTSTIRLTPLPFECNARCWAMSLFLFANIIQETYHVVTKQSIFVESPIFPPCDLSRSIESVFRNVTRLPQYCNCWLYLAGSATRPRRGHSQTRLRLRCRLDFGRRISEIHHRRFKRWYVMIFSLVSQR